MLTSQKFRDRILEIMDDKREEYGRQFSQDPDELAETIMLMYGFDYAP